MRPTAGGDALTGRSRSGSFADNTPTPLAAPYSGPQMSYFLADEQTMAASIAQPQSFSNVPRPRDHKKQANYGVESLESTISSIHRDSDDGRSSRRGNSRRQESSQTVRQTSGRVAQSISPSPRSSPDLSRGVSPILSRGVSPTDTRPSSAHAMHLRPLTPVFHGSGIPESLPSSPESRGHSDIESVTDDGASQAIMSSEEDDQEQDMPADVMDSGTAPQLIMPSIKMPSRRPFTEKGKNLGRLKVLIAGDSGKTIGPLPYHPAAHYMLIFR